MPFNHNIPYRGLPSELRLIIWQYVLDSSTFPEQLVFESVKTNGPKRQSKDGVHFLIPRHCLNILHLDLTTRNEAYSLFMDRFAGLVVLDLSNLRRREDLTRFLDNLPSLAYSIVGEIVINHTSTTPSFPGTIRAAEFEKKRLNDLIDKAVHLRCLIYVIDVRKMLDPIADMVSVDISRLYLDRVWSAADTYSVKSRIAERRYEAARLYIFGDTYIQPAPPDLYERETQSIRSVKMDECELFRGPGDQLFPRALGKYEFLRKFRGTHCTIFTFSKC